MKDPAFLFYSSDFLTGVSELTMEERGQYITLICLQHQKGILSNKLIKINIPNISKDVLLKFKKDGKGNYFNERLNVEIKKRKEHSEKQRLRAISGWKKRKATANATALPLENENENENKSVIINDKINYDEILKIFNLKLIGLPKIQKITDKRKKLIKSIVKEFDLKVIGIVFNKVAESEFLNGNNSNGWTANFDWILNKNNFIKILEDNYKNKTHITNKKVNAGLILRQKRYGTK